MTMQSEHHDADFIHSVAGQMILVLGGLAAVMVVAWFYVF